MSKLLTSELQALKSDCISKLTYLRMHQPWNKAEITHKQTLIENINFILSFINFK